MTSLRRPIKDLHARAPVGRDTARVTFAKGERFAPAKTVQVVESALPIPFEPPRHAAEDLVGRRAGRLKVLGMAVGRNGRWVLRCDCGRYTLRRRASIVNPNNTQDRCEHCRHLAFLKREEVWRRTGKNQDIREF